MRKFNRTRSDDAINKTRNLVRVLFAAHLGARSVDARRESAAPTYSRRLMHERSMNTVKCFHGFYVAYEAVIATMSRREIAAATSSGE